MPSSFIETADGTVLIANGIDPVLRWNGETAQAVPAGVVAPTEAISLAGSGVGTITGSYYAFVRFIDRDGNPSNLSPVSAETVVDAVEKIVYTDVPVPTSSQVARKQIIRNTDGQTDVFYVDVDTTEIDTTTFESSNTDFDLSSAEAVPLFDSTGFPLANRYDPPPSTHPLLAFHINRVWMAGFQSYAEGSVQVTNQSATVTGVGTQWPANFVGRFLYVQGRPAYEIAEVDVENQTLTLTEAYQQATDLFAQYAIQPAPGERNLLVFSEPGLPQAFPPQNALSLPEDGDVVTHITDFGSFLYVFKRRKTYRMSAQTDPTKDAFVFYAIGRGCVNHRCSVVVEEKMYVMDESGVYMTAGGGSVQQLSTPIQNLFRQGDDAAINWSVSRFFHASFDQAGETIRWFVSTRSSYLPTSALCLHYPSGKWTVEHFPVRIGASLSARIARPSQCWGEGPAQVFLGGPAGEVWTLDGLLDGPPAVGPTTRGRPTAAGMDTLTDADASFDTTQSINAPVAVVDGRGSGQLRRIVAATATKLWIDEPWAVKPDTTSTYQIGAIPVRLRSGRMRFAPSETATGRSVEIQFDPTAIAIKLNVGINLDFGRRNRLIGRDVGIGQRPKVKAEKGKSYTTIDISKSSGAHWCRFDGGRELDTDAPRLFEIEIDGFSGPERIILGEFIFNGAVR